MSNRGTTLSEVQMLDSMFSSIPSSGISGHVATAPPSGMYPITNLYWDPAIQKLVGEYDDTGDPSATLVSAPPIGKLAITNIYFNPANGRLVSEYEDET